MKNFIPESMPEIVVEYVQRPGCSPSVWIDEIRVNGEYVSHRLFETILRQYKNEFIQEIETWKQQ